VKLLEVLAAPGSAGGSVSKAQVSPGKPML
jgi:hypothetical protein